MKILQYTFLCLFACFLVACQSSQASKKEDALTKIDSLEKVITADPDVVKNMKSANELLVQMEAYAKAYPTDTVIPDMLLKAGEIARGLGKYDKAIELLQTVWTKFEHHRLAPPALFLQSFTYDNDLQDSTMAVKYYQEFLKRYPDNQLASQVQQLMTVVGKSPDELVRSYKAQNNTGE